MSPEPLIPMAGISLGWAAIALTGCSERPMTPPSAAAAVSAALDTVPPAAWATLASLRVFMGHQSVGVNLFQGLDSLLAGRPGLPLRSIRTGDPGSVPGGAIMHFHVGDNGDAIGKTVAFIQVVQQAHGMPLDIAMHKYCYADFDKTTSVDSVFESYVQRMDALSRERPSVQIVHVTAPVLEDRFFVRDAARRLLGKTTLGDRQRKVREFNALMRARYFGKEPLFDLAAVEAGVRPGTGLGAGGPVEAIRPEYATPDGGHLNELGQQVLAGEFLLFLASLPQRTSS